jgi:hypothetical protein
MPATAKESKLSTGQTDIILKINWKTCEYLLKQKMVRKLDFVAAASWPAMYDV